MDTQQLLEKLCAADGVSGLEKKAADTAAELLSQYAVVRRDALGNVIGTIPGRGTHVLLDAHIDQIGLIVTAIDADGFLRFDHCGGIDARLLCGQDVIVWGKTPVKGTICSTPPHLLQGGDAKKAADFKDLGIDVGMTQEKAQQCISAGDRVTFDTAPVALLGNRFAAPAIDDRAGVAAILLALEQCRGKLKNPVTVVFAVQEEVGTRGAAVGAYASGADEAIAVDVSFAMSPGCPERKCGKLGGGTMIGIAPTLSASMSDAFVRIAEAHGIPYTLEVMGGETGTDADVIDITRNGIRMGLLSIPQRYMHTPVEVVDLRDIEHTAAIIANYLMDLGGETNA